MIIKQGRAKRVIFFHPGEEGTYVDNPTVSLHDSGIVDLRTVDEETTVHISRCEILWDFKEESTNGQVRVLRPVQDKE